MLERGNRTFDPRTKLALGIIGMAAVFMTGNTFYLGVEFLVLFLGLSLFKMLRPWFRSLKLMLPLVGFVFAVSLLSVSWMPAFSLSLRLLTLLTLSFVFFQSLDPQELGDSLRQMGVPYEFSFILTSSLRYVPLITGRMRCIADAQRSRGIDLRLRLRIVPHFMALFMPLLVQAFVLAEQLAMAMEARGFSARGRTFRRSYRISMPEYGVMAFSLGLLIAYGIWGKGC
ncbi:MAG: energy-coupling factor transporter transmembrane protein EcfT [Desulfobulbaceae bacterium]|nr:energy-coupling factor transporter transmembrane protein EcfT [Desulfobulbaceae bacterium]